ncbi:MAG: alpha/beta fold hydrolase [Egibacteraceae bacterium]
MAPGLIPRAVLFATPERTDLAVSPDGRRLAWIAPHEGTPNIWLGDADLGGARPATAEQGRGIRVVVWAYDNHHLLYMDDGPGGVRRLHVVDPETGEDRNLTPVEGVDTFTVGGHPRHPEDLLFTANLEDRRRYDVHRVHVPSGRLDKVVENPGFDRFYCDADLQVRAALASAPDGARRVLVRDRADGDWRVLVEAPADDALSTLPVGFTTDGRVLWVLTSLGADTRRLLRYDLATGEPTVVAADPEHDLGQVRLHPDTGEAQWVTVRRARVHHEPLDDAVAGDLAYLAEAHHGDFSVTGRDHADRVWEVTYTPDDGPVSFHRYERAGRHLTWLFDDRPGLRGLPLARTAAFQVTARDGLGLHGYLTGPPAVRARDLPAVLLVHGGPWERDTWGYDPQVQWLANRGYLVVQVNYRGSAGYGKAFLDAGDREWGGAMHHDLVDTVDWVVDRGYADPARVGILGSSYGGYAALCAATFTPDRFACAVAASAPVDLRTVVASVPESATAQRATVHRRIGDLHDPWLWERSPLSRAAGASIPVLIAQGAKDPRVTVAESEQLLTAWRARGLDHEHLVFDDEGPRIARPANRERFRAATEAFLARHLGGRHET